MDRTLVPEAAVHEDGDLPCREGDVDRATLQARDLQSDSKSQSATMQLSTKREFWRGVRARLSTHPAAHVLRRRRRSLVLCRHELNVRRLRQLRGQTPTGQRGAPTLSYLCDMLGLLHQGDGRVPGTNTQRRHAPTEGHEVSIDVIDVFAGPGGLNEGFSSVTDNDGRRRFRTAASFEMDPWACETLRLRATFRSLHRVHGHTPRPYVDLLAGRLSLTEFLAHPDVEAHAKEALEEVVPLELGEATRHVSDDIIRTKLVAAGGDDWVLIGGPPCQAYSLAGRSRRVGDPTFKDDHKHVLYREYLHVIANFKPAVFVMENVKGMLSSQHEGGQIFQRIKSDLETPRPGLHYEIRSLVVPIEASDLQPSNFIIRSEDYGIPQRRHRVILLGVRDDIVRRQSGVLEKQPYVSVKDAIGDLPPVRSQLSPVKSDSPAAWHEARLLAAALAGARAPKRENVPALGSAWMPYQARLGGDIGAWLVDPTLAGVSLHEARRHMPSDLQRYAYLAYLADRGKFPKVMDLPLQLRPNHKNASRADAPFADRFRVQPWGSPSTTVVSHIAKDGHYYIHPDPLQMRSLTVREAARLQTFPDNYLFVGNRTQQYHQVGNAVPPLLAKQIGEVVAELLSS